MYFVLFLSIYIRLAIFKVMDSKLTKTLNKLRIAPYTKRSCIIQSQILIVCYVFILNIITYNVIYQGVLSVDK